MKTAPGNPDKNIIGSELLLGNGAIARALIEEGVHFIASYPGTPSSEIVPEAVRFNEMHKLGVHIEWSTNEKVAFDNAFAASITGKRSAVVMKQVGLNVAADSLMSAAYTGVVGGFVVVSCDDPGPQSSQTEQDSRLFAHFAKVPVFDPSSPREAMRMVGAAFELSEKFRVPVLLRPGIRVCHALANVEYREPARIARKAEFKKEPGRWAATPRFRLILHRELSGKLEKIAADFESMSDFNSHNLKSGTRYPLGVIAGGVQWANVVDILREQRLDKKIPVLKLGAPFPFPWKLARRFLDAVEKFLVIEETDELIEMYLRNLPGLMGRSTAHVPLEGELVPEVVYDILSNAMKDAGLKKALPPSPFAATDEILLKHAPPQRKPTLCPGCGHRAAFYSIRKAFPKAVFTSDIGCYTLGINLGAVDTVLDMGSGITMASGFYHAFAQDGNITPVIATIGDSTFFHSGAAGLLNAVYNGAKFVLVILDNETTAMTGMQPTPGLGVRADGSKGAVVSVEDVARGCGVKWLKVIDPYDVPGMIALVKEAHAASRAGSGSVAVIIARHKCMVAYRKDRTEREVAVSDECTGCGVCVKQFECPAFALDEKKKIMRINERICSGCGVCVHICPKDAIKIKV